MDPKQSAQMIQADRYRRESGFLRSLIITCILAALLVLPSTSRAQDQSWTAPLRLSQIGDSWFPNIASDEFGRVFVTWSGSVTKAGGGVYDVVMLRERGVSSAWEEPIDIAALRVINGEAYATRPVLLIDQKDTFHMIYRNSLGIHYMQTDELEPTLINAWEKPYTLAPFGYFSNIVEDSTGKLHIIYTTNVPTAECLVCFHIFYRSQDDQGHTWSTSKDISLLPTGAAKPAMILDEEDRLHVTWEAGEGGDLGQLNQTSSIYYSQFDPATQRWAEPLQISEAGIDSRNVSIAQSGNDDLIIAYLSVADSGIYFRRSSDHGSTWSQQVRIEGLRGTYLTALDRIDMATDSAGDVHLVTVGRLDGQPEVDGDLETRAVLHTSWDGSSWSLPESIALYAGDVPEWPGIAVSEGNVLHVVWFVRDYEHIWQGGAGKYTVWYSTEVTDAPHLSPQPITTNKPTSAAESQAVSIGEDDEVSTSLEGTPAQLPGNLEQVEGGLVQETDFVAMLVKSLLPVVVLVSAAIGYMVFRRK